MKILGFERFGGVIQLQNQINRNAVYFPDGALCTSLKVIRESRAGGSAAALPRCNEVGDRCVKVQCEVWGAAASAAGLFKGSTQGCITRIMHFYYSPKIFKTNDFN